jgi:hypothetical protein
MHRILFLSNIGNRWIENLSQTSYWDANVVPFIDIANHEMGACRFRIGQKMIELFVGPWGVQKGDDIYLDYGPHISAKPS